ncbi:MAG: T9SS type A sorting domain-containing protein [Flavobacterium sp.]|jgi:endo-1,3(4)-beta-glucanase|nr:T9SS type A sorting domain-containing protein [Flavobacterium sp.]
MKNRLQLSTSFIILICCFLSINIYAQNVTVGNGGYTTSFPGTDSAGRNAYPSGSPQLSGNAIGKPVPTNDWWSKLIKENHADNLFNYPMTLRTTNQGLIVSHVPWGVIGDSAPIEIGLTGLTTNKTTVSDYSDWTVTMNWNDGSHNLNATSGIGMPFLYFSKGSSDVVEITINSGTATISDEVLLIENASNAKDFVFYAPTGSSWSQNGSVFSSSLNGQNYWSMAMLPENTLNTSTLVNQFKQYAYVFPTNTTTSWDYNEANAKITTTFNVTTEIKEGTNTTMLLGLLPHQWNNLSPDSSTPNDFTYDVVRGKLKTLDGNSFVVENTFKGILPTLPYLANYSEGFSPAEMDQKISQIENDGLATWTDSYNEGQMMNRMIQTARIADQTGDFEARDKMIATIKERLEDWLKAESGEVAFIFYYNNTWSTMIGYPAGHGQDNNINDHHFHWGYFIHAASFMEQFEPGWSDDWGEMINLLIRDAASYDRDDQDFPFLRNFSPYAGHSWANGFATFPQGNDQESTSESMQFASSLIHWGTITENDSIRDLGIYIYTTEQTAVEEYWFDIYNQNFAASTAPFSQDYSLVSRVWGNSFDNGTFWTSDIAASYGIELYPIHGGSLYLGHHQEYATSLWNEMASNTGILNNEENPNLWHDTYWKYLSLTDAQTAIDLYNSNPNRALKFGISDAQTYHWLHSMNALGTIEASITADYPISAAFINNGEYTYVAHNYSDVAITVTFSDNFTLNVPANQMATSRDINVSGVISSDFNQAYPGGSVNLSLDVTGTGITNVEFFDGATLIGQDSTAPYEIEATDLTLGVHGMYAKVFINNEFNVSNTVTIQVGEQVPYLGTPFEIPGTIEAGFYDKFEGGVGQNISYLDMSQINEGDFRTTEYVDAASVTNEGATVGWNSIGEWLEYTINVETAGLYNLSFRYASGNSNGGGPFHFEIDGNTVSPSINMTTTNGWDSWSTKNVSNLELREGKQILRLFIDNGEFNIGRMTFSYASPLSYIPPIANAGDNVTVILPDTTATLDGTLSNDPAGESLTYNWEQVYGPSIISFSNNLIASPEITNLIEGVYKCNLTVSDGSFSDTDEVLVIVSQTGNSTPSISITSPNEGTSFEEGTDINITTSVSDLDGTVTLVEFYDGTEKIGEDTSDPFTLLWSNVAIGIHQISAVATDDASDQGTSQIINISVEEVSSCSEISNEAQQGSFSIGYEALFETVGSQVTISFTLLDTDKNGVVAYLWQETPFLETQMEQVSGLTFSKTINGFSPGQTISYACKFAFAGGLAVTKYINYVVGNDCSGSNNDDEAPSGFTATSGNITARSIELLLNGNDDSGTIIYDVSYGSETTTVTGSSGNIESLIINNLEPETTYQFSVEASDLSGNEAENNPIDIQITTSADENTQCSGSDSEASEGEFSTGYNYSFETSGTNVIFTFELLDTDRTGVIAYLWKESPFSEAPMTNVSGYVFTKTVGGFTEGETISYACKFAFAGGLAVTKYFSYQVGSNCSSLTTNELTWSRAIKLFPNPTKDIFSIESKQVNVSKVEIYSILGKKLKEYNTSITTFDIEDLSNGLYMVKIYSEKGMSTIKKLVKK